MPGEGRNASTPSPSALTGKRAALAKALEAVEAASAALEKANATRNTTSWTHTSPTTSWTVPPRGRRSGARFGCRQAAESARRKRAALEESAKANAEAARLAKEVHEECESSANSETAELDESATVAVKVATLRMKATRAAAKAMAAAAAAGGRRVEEPQGCRPGVRGRGSRPAPEPAEETEDEPYVPEGGGGDDEEYVPMDAAGGGGGDVEALLATLREAAKDPEVFHEMLAALPPEQRAAIEAHMADQ